MVMFIIPNHFFFVLSVIKHYRSRLTWLFLMMTSEFCSLLVSRSSDLICIKHLSLRHRMCRQVFPSMFCCSNRSQSSLTEYTGNKENTQNQYIKNKKNTRDKYTMNGKIHWENIHVMVKSEIVGSTDQRSKPNLWIKLFIFPYKS